MRDLLQLAGNRIRSATRADCTRCPGSSTGTVAYTDQVAYCHRCQWRANRVMLERELGLRPANRGRGRKPTPAEQAAAERRRLAEAEIAALEAWLEWKLREIAQEEQFLLELKPRLSLALDDHPENDALWDALAFVIRRLRELDAEWEFYFREKLPQYRETRATVADIHRAFRLALWRRIKPA